MRPVVTAAAVEDAARTGQAQLDVPADAILTPLARDRAAALGVSLNGHGNGAGMAAPVTAAAVDVGQLVLESRVRMVTRRVLLRADQGLSDYETIVTAVLRALAQEAGKPCACSGKRCGRGGSS
jgi:hypothetical protein